MGIKVLHNDNLRKLPNEYGDVSVMNQDVVRAKAVRLKICIDTFVMP